MIDIEDIQRFFKYKDKQFNGPINNSCKIIYFVAHNMLKIANISLALNMIYEDTKKSQPLDFGTYTTKYYSFVDYIQNKEDFKLQQDQFTLYKRTIHPPSEFEEFQSQSRCTRTIIYLGYFLFGLDFKFPHKYIFSEKTKNSITEYRQNIDTQFSKLSHTNGCLTINLILNGSFHSKNDIDYSHVFMIVKKNEKYMILQSDYYNTTLSEQLIYNMDNNLIDESKLNQIQNLLENIHYDNQPYVWEYQTIKELSHLLFGKFDYEPYNNQQHKIYDNELSNAYGPSSILIGAEYREFKQEHLCYSYLNDFLTLAEQIFIIHADELRRKLSENALQKLNINQLTEDIRRLSCSLQIFAIHYKYNL